MANFPVQMGVSGNDVLNVQNQNIFELIRREGFPFDYNNFNTVNFSSSNQSAVVNATGNFSNYQRLILTRPIYLTASDDCTVFYSANSDPTGSFPSILGSVHLPARTAVPIGGSYPVYPLQFSFGLYADAAKAAAGKSVTIGVSTSGIMINNDLNFNAKKKIVWFGDSITAYTWNLIGMQNCFPYAVRDWLNLNSPQKNVCRMVNKGMSGRTGVSFSTMLTDDIWSIDDPDIVFWQHGTNDASQSVGTTAFVAAINNFIAYKKQHWPNAWMVFLGSTPRQDNTAETLLATYRAAEAAAVAAAGDSKIIYISLANAFDRTLSFSSVWASSDTAGNGLHPGTLYAHQGITNTITAGLAAAGITI
jgi:lysophospholipase L1-like esterase